MRFSSVRAVRTASNSGASIEPGTLPAGLDAGAGDVVARGRGPVRPLDQEAEEGLLLGREEHDQRGAVPGEEPGFALRGVGPEGQFDPLARVPEVVQRAVPDEPGFGPVPAALAPDERDLPGRPGLRCWGA